jgi:hypothetical protein
MKGLEQFDEVWCCDTEYSAPTGHRPTPVCLVAQELMSGRQLRVWADDLARMPGCPFRTDAKALFVAYYCPAEFSVFHALGWEQPERVLDLFVEFRATTNGLRVPSGNGLLGAMVYHGLDAMAAAEKDDMRALAIEAQGHTRQTEVFAGYRLHNSQRLNMRLAERLGQGMQRCAGHASGFQRFNPCIA